MNYENKSFPFVGGADIFNTDLKHRGTREEKIFSCALDINFHFLPLQHKKLKINFHLSLDKFSCQSFASTRKGEKRKLLKYQVKLHEYFYATEMNQCVNIF